MARACFFCTSCCCCCCADTVEDDGIAVEDRSCAASALAPRAAGHLESKLNPSCSSRSFRSITNLSCKKSSTSKELTTSNVIYHKIRNTMTQKDKTSPRPQFFALRSSGTNLFVILQLLAMEAVELCSRPDNRAAVAICLSKNVLLTVGHQT